MRQLLRLFALCLLWTSLATAQTAKVTRNVNLRSDASTNSDVLEKLKPGAQLQLVDPDETTVFTMSRRQTGRMAGYGATALEFLRRARRLRQLLSLLLLRHRPQVHQAISLRSS